MTKTKKKKLLSDRKLHTIKKEPKKLNAFEMHINRRKFNVVGMKLKAEKGLPGISRSKAIKKRKATLMQEYRVKDKKNTFLDRRIGEKNSAMTQEDKIMARFTAQRVKHHNKKSVFNLGDGEELTHRGETLTEIEKYDDPKSDDEFDEDDRDGKLDAEFVGEAHFGGGILKKVDGESKSRKDLIDQLIEESKKKKAEKQKMREETLDLTQKLDTEWKELLPFITSSKKTDADTDSNVKKDKKTASYDMLTKQLKFEARGKPMDRLKSEEEIARKEKERLEALEKERLDRMLGENKTTAVKHRSADDMDDGFDLDDGSDLMLSYGKDGLPVMPMGESGIFEVGKGGSILKRKKPEEERNEEEQEQEDDRENEEEEDQEDDSQDESDEGNHGCDSSADEADDLIDLKESDESDVEQKTAEEKQKKKKIIENIKESKKQVKFDSVPEQVEDIKETSKEEIIVEKLPFTFDVPNDYNAFEKLMNDSDCATQTVIIERMIKCNHPSLKDSNKDKLDTLFTYLLQHLEDAASEKSSEVNCFEILDNISPFLYDLAMWNPDSCASAMSMVIQEKYQHFIKRSKIYPNLDTIIFIKLVSVLFSTSDYRHKVATPTLIFMQEMLSCCRISSSVDLSLGLCISTLILEFCSFSKRFVPEVFHFIKGVLRLSHPKESEIPILLPFRSQDLDKFNLIVSDKSRSYATGSLGFKQLTTEDNSEEFKLNAVSLSLKILSELCDLMSDKNGAFLIFESFLPLLNVECFSTCLKTSVEKVVEKILALKNKPLERLAFERKRPRPLKLYEPRIEEVYSLKRHKPMGREKQERAKLQHKYKREMKGALREIRKDSSFLAKLKFKEVQKSDAERQRKVREIINSVSQQTGEVRKLKRKK